MNKEDKKRYYDLVYEAWTTGNDPDLVSEDAYDHMRMRGFYPNEIELRDVYPRPDLLKEHPNE